MSGLSIGETLVSGFGLVVRRPLDVLLWGLVFTAITILPLALVFGPLLSGLPALVRAAQQGGQAADVSDAVAMRVAGGVLLAVPLLLIAVLIAHATITGAVYRSVLEPARRGFASLRFGGQELWLVLLAAARWIVFGVLGGAVMFGAGLVCVLGLLVSAWLPQPWAGVVRAPFFAAAALGAVATGVWVWLRLSLAGPMTFAEQQFRLFESWTLTRGHVKELLGLGGLLLVIRQGLPILLLLPVYGCVMLFATTSIGFVDFGRVGSAPFGGQIDAGALIAAVTPVVLLAILIVMLAIGALQAVFLAPWAVAYRELSRKAKPEHPAVF
jgi:hypothetical protein